MNLPVSSVCPVWTEEEGGERGGGEGGDGAGLRGLADASQKGHPARLWRRRRGRGEHPGHRPQVSARTDTGHLQEVRRRKRDGWIPRCGVQAGPQPGCGVKEGGHLGGRGLNRETGFDGSGGLLGEGGGGGGVNTVGCCQTVRGCTLPFYMFFSTLSLSF